MIIPSIDLQRGQTVQLVGGEELKIAAGDPHPIAERFSLAGEIAVIDLDAAMGPGSNAALIESLVSRFDCRVGGGIRDVESAIRWLDAGASKVILGTAARPEVLRELPRARVIAALDARDGEVVVEGWKTGTGSRILERVRELRDYVGGFLVTFVEREGRMAGTAMEQVAEIVEAAGEARVTIAGGVTTAAEIAELDRLGADAQVGMALYSGALSLGAAISAPLVSDRPDGLWPTVVCDENGVALGMAYSNAASLEAAVERRQGVYWSRRRGLWAKGETSGAVQELLKIDLDCDRDTLRFTVRQKGGFCHLGTRTCWGEDAGIARLARRLGEPKAEGSYTARLLSEPGLLPSKLREEVEELLASDADVPQEAADVLYYTLVRLVQNGISLETVDRILDRRERRVTRRPGNAKQP